MARRDFDSLSTEQFRKHMRPYAIAIYRQLWPGCDVADLRADGCKVHILDKEFGIDALVNMRSGQWISLQEKYRENMFLAFGDFTQEYKNADGTPYEAPGEWFKLAAQLYFYGWANADATGFAKWLLMDIPRYKLLIEKRGGIEHMGKKHYNWTHGRASFYAIPLEDLKSATVMDSEMFPAWLRGRNNMRRPQGGDWK